LQTFVVFEPVTNNLSDFEIIRTNRGRNAWSALRVRGFANVEFEARDVKVRVRPFIAEVEHVGGSRGVVPNDLVRTKPTLQQLPSWPVLLRGVLEEA